VGEGKKWRRVHFHEKDQNLSEGKNATDESSIIGEKRATEKCDPLGIQNVIKLNIGYKGHGGVRRKEVKINKVRQKRGKDEWGYTRGAGTFIRRCERGGTFIITEGGFSKGEGKKKY